ncbi:MAG: tetratricopeptide repeat protein [Bryobacteraceae bacterium]
MKQLPFLATTVIFLACTRDQPSKLGNVNFPTSASGEVQAHFLRGVAALHSFWYEEALDEFRQATKIDPNFAMGYWGEAMAHNHPIRGDPQNTEAARQALAKIGDTARLTERERVYINAVGILYGPGDKPARDQAYAEAMEKLYREYPEDPEAASLYALALLGSAHHGEGAVRQRMQAAAIAQEVFRKNPNHPGAAHYVIHAFDDPDHAILGLPAAKRYAEIAPEAYHARHMPSHIFLQLGMWPEAAASNESAWAASVKMTEERHLPINRRDYHSLHWLLYICLQQGRYDEAREQLELMRTSLAQFDKQDKFRLLFGTFTYSSMAAADIVETERWDAAKPVEADQGMLRVAQSPLIFAQGMAAAARGLPAGDSIAALKAMRELPVGLPEALSNLPKIVEIQAMEIAAVSAAAKGGYDEAVEIVKKAVAIEQSMPPPSGPPMVIKPAHELLGEVLLQAGRPAEAAQQFEISLARHPNRARSVQGLARARKRP